MTIISARVWDPAAQGSNKTVQVETADTVDEAIGKIRQICTIAEQPAPIETQADRAMADHGDQGPAEVGEPSAGEMLDRGDSDDAAA